MRDIKGRMETIFFPNRLRQQETGRQGSFRYEEQNILEYFVPTGHHRVAKTTSRTHTNPYYDSVEEMLCCSTMKVDLAVFIEFSVPFGEQDLSSLPLPCLKPPPYNGQRQHQYHKCHACFLSTPSNSLGSA
ncbi:hypothetical protein GALMADRAFT_1035737 [Galerina marginata CBS 339.88]|uniref:Uncharacterized protein n=1 Tax=Galerina marginata (strain CBS 339.88) TaxID=685588 RepID=A0A067SEY2_GALM3|nr:hypothetical protein GALMADRAFT_1035737 [Galerina marginata CBS 339.88]